MTSLAIAAVGLAAFGFFAWHIYHTYSDDQRDARLREELKSVKKELNDEILHSGNTARIATLCARLLDLEDRLAGR